MILACFRLRPTNVQFVVVVVKFEFVKMFRRQGLFVIWKGFLR